DLTARSVGGGDDVVVREHLSLVVIERTRAQALHLTVGPDLDRHHAFRGLLRHLGPVRSLDRLIGDLARFIALASGHRIVAAEGERAAEEGGDGRDRDRRAPPAALLLPPRRLLRPVGAAPVRPAGLTRTGVGTHGAGLRSDICRVGAGPCRVATRCGIGGWVTRVLGAGRILAPTRRLCPVRMLGTRGRRLRAAGVRLRTALPGLARLSGLLLPMLDPLLPARVLAALRVSRLLARLLGRVLSVLLVRGRRLGPTGLRAVLRLPALLLGGTAV